MVSHINSEIILNPLYGGRVNEGFELDTSNFEEIQIKQNAKGEVGEVERSQWTSQREFLLSCIAMSVGLGNIWRFPFVAYENGGGAFLLPYLFVLTFIGRPIYFLELILGQFTSKGPVNCWDISPLFRGVGYGIMGSAIALVSYYVSIMAVTAHYFVNSFSYTLPWSTCVNYTEEINCQDNTDVISKRPNSELYYYYEVLKSKNSIDDGIGVPEWRLTLCLLFSWLFIMFSLIKGIKSSGKVAYFTAIFPYVVIISLLIRGVTLDGAVNGIIFFLNPKWDRLLNISTWYAAVTQCFFSLGIGQGVLIMFSSHNPFKHNIYKDALIVSLIDTFTSLLAGCAIFSIIGHMAYKVGENDISKVTKTGAGLAFISYPAALELFGFVPVPQIFSALFFLMLFTLGAGTGVAIAGGIISVISDKFPAYSRWKITVVVCTSEFLIGLIYVTPGGQFMYTLVETYSGTSIMFLMGTLELIGICWVYGLQKFLQDVEFMLGFKIGLYWVFTWGFFAPILLIIIFFYNIITTERLTHEEKPYPDYVLAIGWYLYAFLISLVVIIPIYGISKIKSPEGLFEKIKKFANSQNGGPMNSVIRAEWKIFKENYEKVPLWKLIYRKFTYLCKGRFHSKRFHLNG